MLGILGVVALAAALGWVILRLKARDRIVLGGAIAVSLAAVISLHLSDRRSSKREKAVREACQVLATDLRSDVQELDRLGRQTDPFAQLNLLNFRNGYSRTSLERRKLAELCVASIRDCFPMELSNDTKGRALAAAEALEGGAACPK